MLLHNVILVLVASFCCTVAQNETIYDSYTDLPASKEQLQMYEEAGVTATCTNPVALPCDPNEWRRMDGSCNNMEHVSRGMFCTPLVRLLEPNFNIENGTYNPRLTKSGEPLDLARVIREKILSVGSALGTTHTQAFSYMMEHTFNDFGSAHDTLNVVFTVPYCCEERGKTEFMCVPNIIPQNDSVHQFSGIRCMNHTRPMAFQNVGCLSSNTPPDRVDFTTTHFDLSNMYCSAEGCQPNIRTYESGLLKTEKGDNQDFPSAANDTTTCFIPDAIKTGCTRDVPNVLLGNNMFVILFWRYHNYIARKLAEVNPCWDDELLFQNARDIIIASYNQILFHELFASAFGRERMVEEGIICSGDDFCDNYDSTIAPHMTMESSYAFRYFHLIQDGNQKMYDKNGNYLGRVAIGNFTLRTQDLATDNKMSKIVNGMIKQATGAFDHIIHAELAEKGLGRWQNFYDIATADLNKGRYSGNEIYIEYLSYYTGKNYTCFEDLLDVMEQEQMESLQDCYKDVSDIELMAGIWSENIAPGGYVPYTVANLILHQLRISVVTDRHWYERSERPHAYTSEQLQEIRKTTIALLLCTVGDVISIQPHAFLLPGTGNEVGDCSELPQIDFSKWKDSSCSSDCDE